MRNYLILDGVDSRDFGVYISGQGTFGAPSKAYAYHDVPGRNGAYITSDKRFNNIEVTYPAFIYADFKTNISNFRNFLLSREGYVRLEDTYNTDEFRLASYTGSFEPEVTSINDAGRFDIVFNCKPQRFLKRGENKSNNVSSCTNSTRFPSKPLFEFTITTELSFTIKNSLGQWQITSSGLQSAGITSVTIDCETMQAYNTNGSLNSFITIGKIIGGETEYATDFPVLAPGVNRFTRGTGVSVWITPRWWQL